MSESKSLEERSRLLRYLEGAHSTPSAILSLKGREVVIQITKGAYTNEESSVVVPHTDFRTVVVDKVFLRLETDHLEVRILTSPFTIYLGDTHRAVAESVYIQSIIKEGEVHTSIAARGDYTSVDGEIREPSWVDILMKRDTPAIFFVDGEILDGNCKPYLFSRYTKRDIESAWEDNRDHLRDL